MDAVKTAGMGIGRMALKMPQIGPMAGQIQSMANDYKITTTNIEAFGVAANKVTSAQLAGMNMTGKELRKTKSRLAGIAFGLNAPIDQVTESFISLQQASVDVRKVGFKSFEDYQKFVSAAGIDSKEFAISLGQMGKQLRSMQ